MFVQKTSNNFKIFLIFNLYCIYIYIYMYIELESLLFVIKSFVSKVEANVMCYLVSIDIISK
jgi:hypothetical protein